MRISQAHLMRLSTCPRQFQYLFLDQLGLALETEEQTRLLQGSQFHQLIQQWDLGLPIAPLLQTHPQLDQWFQQFQAAIPQILQLPMDSDAECLTRLSEQKQILDWEGQALVVVYDLLLLGDRQAHILDWKTYGKPQQVDRLANHWQTKLYPFVLAETSDYEPDQISMTYWFFEGDSCQEVQPAQSLTFPWSRDRHMVVATELTQLLNQFAQWWQAYELLGSDFPQVVPQAGHCQVCPFQMKCGRSMLEETQAAAEPSGLGFAAIPEIVL
ncbi:MAG: PD-(D/E)XK nuclease family protein [Synechococcales bacterium]|nr:PD-(D/E)XK nuclease family protein [Synechococcales bacterium]